MQKTWIVAADSSRARVFEVEGVGQNFQEVQDFYNGPGREHYQDLRSDAKGRFWGKGEREQGHTAEPNVTAEVHETELFMKQVCEFIDKGRVEHRYDKLFLIAYPKVLGLMRDNLSKETHKLIDREIPKEISGLDAREIEDFYLKHRLPDA